jgi:hypothetical protein
MSVTILSALLSYVRKVKTVAINIFGHENRGMALFIMLLLFFTGITCVFASSQSSNWSFSAPKTVQSLPVDSGQCSTGHGTGKRDWAFDLLFNVN